MKRVAVLGLLLMVLGMYAYATPSSPAERITVGVWVAVADSTLRTRVVNEITARINNNPNWNMVVEMNSWDTDVHFIVTGMPIPQTQAYAWGITVTPIFAPHWTNGTVATSAANVGGMNWIAASAVEYLITQLYAWYDAVLGDPSTVGVDTSETRPNRSNLHS